MSEAKKCPECGEKMEKGYIKLMEGIRWRTDENRRGELLQLGAFLWPKEYEGYLCRKCQLLLLNYQSV
jgi:hypothetical protein